MGHQTFMFVLYSLSIFPCPCQTVHNPGNCTLPNSSSIRCCPGYFLIENKCNECEPGTTGVNCSETCPPGYYGRQCRGRCDCTPDMYCEPIKGCMCNTTMANCTDSEHKSTQAMNMYSTSSQSSKYADGGVEITEAAVVPLLIPVIACLVFGIVCIVCIRIRYSQILKRRKARTHRSETDEHNPNDEIYDHLNLRIQQFNHNINDLDNSVIPVNSALGSMLNTDAPLEQSQSFLDKPHKETVDSKTKNPQPDIYSTPYKLRMKKSLYGCSEREKRSNGDETMNFEYPKPINNKDVNEPISRSKSCSKWTQDKNKEIYANGGDMAYTDNNLRPDSQQLESDDSEDYFDVSYEGQLNMLFN